MLSIAASTPVYLYTRPADMRKSFDGLAGLVVSAAEDDDPLLSGSLFVFHNKRRDRLKILYFDHDGLALWYKRLEQGTFTFPAPLADQDRVAVSPADLRLILDGIDLRSVKKFKRYTPAVTDDGTTDPRSRRPGPAQAAGGGAA